MISTCQVPDCERPARGRLCDMHWKRQERGKPVATPAEALLALVGRALDLGDVPTGEEHDGGFEAEVQRLRAAAHHLCLAEGWTAPEGVQARSGNIQGPEEQPDG